jgi:F-type H+-transporting ATPase subunit delta
MRDALTDPHLPASRRQQIVEELLGSRASALTVAIVSMIVGSGRARDLPAIVDALVAKSAAEQHRAVAEVRSAVELTADQQHRLAAAIERATGKQVEVKVVVDPSVLGGAVTTVGDTVIDGSVRTRLDQLKQTF